jgi:spore coat polysaccharide biosynthesis protein SpsF
MTTVGFYVKAGPEHGYGHVVRSIALADELRKRGAVCLFRGNHTAVRRAGLAGFEPTPNHDIDLDVWIVDLPGGIPLKLATRLVPYAKVLVSLHGAGGPDGDLGRFLTDLVIYQGVTRRPIEIGWSGFDGEWFEGVEWLILRKQFQYCRAARGTHKLPRVVIACGASDPKCVATKTLNALAEEPCRMRLIQGPHGYVNWLDVVDMPDTKYSVATNPRNMAMQLSRGNDVAVVSYGMTAFECLCLGLPTIALSISPDHAASADLVQQQEDVTDQDIREAVASMLHDAPELSERARGYVDGRGVERVADKILETLEGKT